MESTMTPTALMLLRALQATPGREMYGLEMVRASGSAPGTVYPLLARMTEAGWITSRDEHISPAAEGRPRRRYYRITSAGHLAVSEATEWEAARSRKLGSRTGAARALARGLLQIADLAGMPDTFWRDDRRVRLARTVLGVPEDGRYTHAALWDDEAGPLPVPEQRKVRNGRR
jgi:DNA-binding PadR family transcriptional regulator